MNKTINPFEQKFQSAVPGLRANTSGKTKCTLLGRACGAERAGGENDNLWAIDGASVRFHSVSGGKSTFTLNPATEPPRLIVALTQDKPEGDKPVRYWLYGLTLGACTQAGRPAKGKSAPGRLTVSVGQIQDRIDLGYSDLPTQYVEITTVPDRDAALSRIDRMTAEELMTIMGVTTREKVRAFVLAGRDEAAPVSLEAPPAVVDAVPAVKQVPVEPEMVPTAERAFGESEVAPTAQQGPAESELAPATEQEPVEPVIEGGLDEGKNHRTA
jgi:hypothetical protein